MCPTPAATVLVETAASQNRKHRPGILTVYTSNQLTHGPANAEMVDSLPPGFQSRTADRERRPHDFRIDDSEMQLIRPRLSNGVPSNSCSLKLLFWLQSQGCLQLRASFLVTFFISSKTPRIFSSYQHRLQEPRCTHVRHRLVHVR